MNKLFFIIGLYLSFSLSANAQSIKELDAKHGFKEFTLGDDLSKWQSDLLYNRTWDDNDTLRRALQRWSSCIATT